MKLIYHKGSPFNRMHDDVLKVSNAPLLKTLFHNLHQKAKLGLGG
jgi:hypothetical protein